MNKQEMIAKIAGDTGIPKTTAAAAVDSLFDGIVKTLKKSGSITFLQPWPATIRCARAAVSAAMK